MIGNANAVLRNIYHSLVTKLEVSTTEKLSVV